MYLCVSETLTWILAAFEQQLEPPYLSRDTWTRSTTAQLWIKEQINKQQESIEGAIKSGEKERNVLSSAHARPSISGERSA